MLRNLYPQHPSRGAGARTRRPTQRDECSGPRFPSCASSRRTSGNTSRHVARGAGSSCRENGRLREGGTTAVHGTTEQAAVTCICSSSSTSMGCAYRYTGPERHSPANVPAAPPRGRNATRGCDSGKSRACPEVGWEVRGATCRLSAASRLLDTIQGRRTTTTRLGRFVVPRPRRDLFRASGRGTALRYRELNGVAPNTRPRYETSYSETPTPSVGSRGSLARASWICKCPLSAYGRRICVL